MKAKNRDTFLISHARRMRLFRLKQQQNNPEAYKIRLNAQRREHRLRSRNAISTNQQKKEKNKSQLKMRQSNKTRQRRYRSRLSEQKKLNEDRKIATIDP